jgi:hypothetical protein
MKSTLLPITRLALYATGIVPAIFALIMIFAPSLHNSLVFPPPFDPMGGAIRLFTAASYLAFTVGMLVALSRNEWRVAYGVLAVSGSYNLFSLVAGLVLAFTQPGIPPIVWLYNLLAVIYIVVVGMAFRQQEGA